MEPWLEAPTPQVPLPQWLPCPGPPTAYPYQTKSRYKFDFWWINISGPNITIDVSGLYGPGAHISWLLTVLSVLASACFRKESSPRGNILKEYIDADIIASILYAMIASGDLIHKSSFMPTPSVVGNYWINAKHEAAFLAAAQTVWIAFVFLVALIGLHKRGEHSGSRYLAILYLAFWICATSYLLARRWLLFGLQPQPQMLATLMYQFRDVIINLEIPLRLLVSAPLLLSYRFLAIIRSKKWKFVITLALMFLYKPIMKITMELRAVLHHYYFIAPDEEERSKWWPKGPFHSIYRSATHPEYLKTKLKMIIPVTNHQINDLDQLAALVTTSVVLAWQWKAWKWALYPIKELRRLWNLSFSSLLRTSGNDAPINLEDLENGNDP
ncbi:hypothetical protein CPB86DRAFT_861167 [Serendipita vermifera]|nr:hypothetical protein CPB86DRAFT_861167 [Serendipita vermifera]